MTINSTAAVLLGLLTVLAERRGMDPAALRGTVQNDLLKEYIARGTYVFPPRPSLRLTADLFRWCREHTPHWNTISISGYHIREAGSTAVQELAFTFANAKEYVKAGVAAGLDVDEFAPRLSFFFNVHSNLFEEVAKFRAARRIWARMMREELGAKDPKSWMLRFHSQTAGSTLTAQERVGVSVSVGVVVAVLVAVGVSVSVDVLVAVGVSVSVGVLVAVLVAVGVSVSVDVLVAVGVLVFVGVLLGVDVLVAVGVFVCVGVLVEVTGSSQSWI
jgi:methylmalonyl-CoA mutase N-terminal domain/subunit